MAIFGNVTHNGRIGNLTFVPGLITFEPKAYREVVRIPLGGIVASSTTKPRFGVGNSTATLTTASESFEFRFTGRRSKAIANVEEFGRLLTEVNTPAA